VTDDRRTFRIEIRRRAIGGRRSFHWEIFREAQSTPISTSFMIYSTEKEARLDAELELARLLRPTPQPDEY
jgi:hypothetical protein